MGEHDLLHKAFHARRFVLEDIGARRGIVTVFIVGELGGAHAAQRDQQRSQHREDHYVRQQAPAAPAQLFLFIGSGHLQHLLIPGGVEPFPGGFVEQEHAPLLEAELHRLAF